MSLLAALIAAHSARALTDTDIPDVLLCLLLIAIDPTTSSEIKRDIVVTVDIVSNSIQKDSAAVSL